MRITLLFCAALLAAPFGTGHAQTVWKWKDEKGVTHYSDQPGPGAVRVELSSQTFSSDEARTDIQVDTSPRPRAEPAQSYNALQITSPQHDQTMFASEGPVNVQVNVDPGLQPGHSIQILLDGVNISAEGSTALSATLSQVDRGTHSLQAKVVDSNGETVVSSTTVMFHVQQTSINSPAYNQTAPPGRPGRPPRPTPRG
jgi:hypothetical protein